MKIDLTQNLMSISDPEEPLEEFEKFSNPNFISTVATPNEGLKGVRKVIINLRRACLSALLGNFDADRTVTGIEKNKWAMLAVRIQENDTVDFTSEEITLIKERIGIAYGSEVVGPAYAAIDPVKEETDG